MQKPERVLVLRRGMVIAPRQVFSEGARALSRSDILWTRRSWDAHARQMTREKRSTEGIEVRPVEV